MVDTGQKSIDGAFRSVTDFPSARHTAGGRQAVTVLFACRECDRIITAPRITRIPHAAATA